MTMKIAVLFTMLINTATALLGLSTSSFPKFTCNVLQFEGNGCNATDILPMELLISTLYITELTSVSTIYFTDFLGNKQDVFNISPITGLITYTCSSSLLSALSLCLPGGGRRLARNICTQPNYCKQNKQTCILAGCATSSRRRLGAPVPAVLSEGPSRELASTFNITDLTIKGTTMIQNMISVNPQCKPKDLGFRCDLV